MAKGPSILWRSPFIDYPFASNPTTAHSIVLFLWLNGWSRPNWCATFLNDIKNVQMLTFRTLMHVLYKKVSSLLRPETWCGFCWYSDLISHTQTGTTHLGASRPAHPCKYIFTPTVTCSQQLSLLHWMIIHWHQKFTFHNFFSFQRLFTCQSHIYWLTRFFLWNANNNDRNGVNKQNTHTHTKRSEKNI